MINDTVHRHHTAGPQSLQSSNLSGCSGFESVSQVGAEKLQANGASDSICGDDCQDSVNEAQGAPRELRHVDSTKLLRDYRKTHPPKQSTSSLQPVTFQASPRTFMEALPQGCA
eukprot:scaffold5559_cov51-Prasinocladus_malaysianus.AAC.3